MKNNKIIVIVGVFIVLVSISLLYIFNDRSLDEKIFNKNWYKYNYKTGYYDVINISGDNFSYIIPTNNNESDSFDKCTRYNYNSKKKEIKLNCNKSIYVKEINEDYIILNIDKVDNYFYLSNLDSLNHEFSKYFNMSIGEYKKSKNTVLNLIKINTSKINEIYNSDEYHIISNNVYEDDSSDTKDYFMHIDSNNPLVKNITNENAYVNEKGVVSPLITENIFRQITSINVTATQSDD